jgi:hypothetical protein
MGAKPVGYLARIGPAPLRFQAPAPGPEHTVVLPPLAMSDPLPEMFGPPAPAVIEPVIQPQPSAPTPEPPRQPELTPQMFLPFFNRSATNQDYNLALPYVFTPPVTAIPAPPSKATFTK